MNLEADWLKTAEPEARQELRLTETVCKFSDMFRNKTLWDVNQHVAVVVIFPQQHNTYPCVEGFIGTSLFGNNDTTSSWNILDVSSQRVPQCQRLFALVLNSWNSSKLETAALSLSETAIRDHSNSTERSQRSPDPSHYPAAAQTQEMALISSSVRSHLPPRCLRRLRITVQTLNASAEPKTLISDQHTGSEETNTGPLWEAQCVRERFHITGPRSDKPTAPFLRLIRFLKAICGGMEAILRCEKTPAKKS